MVNKCCVPRCFGNYNESNKVHVFKFPKDEDMRRKWLSAIKREAYVPTRNSVVCHRHFTEADICRYTQYYDEARGRVMTVKLDKIRLREKAIPSVFPCWRSAWKEKHNVTGTVTVYRSDHTYAQAYPFSLKRNREDVADSDPKTSNISSSTARRNQVVARGPNKTVPQYAVPRAPSCSTRIGNNTGAAGEPRVLRESNGWYTYTSGAPRLRVPAVAPPVRRSSSSQQTCAVFRCFTNVEKMPGVVCHTFPKDEHLRREWLERCRRTDQVNIKTSRVCSVHFRPEDYKRDLRNELLGLPLRKKLFPSAVPSLNLPSWDECRDARKKVHFEESQFEQNRADRKKKLKPNAIPTLFDVPNPQFPDDLRRNSTYKRKLQRDIENYLQYRLGFSKRLLLVKGVVPSKFHCQKDHRKRLGDCSTSRAAFAETDTKGGRLRKKLRQCDNDDEGNTDVVEHQVLVDPQEVIIKEEIIVKEEVESDPDDTADADRQQDWEYITVKEEPIEDPDESTCSATEELGEQMGHDQELPLIIKEEIDCDDYIDPLHIPQQAYWQ